jgi:hypothetical protein
MARRHVLRRMAFAGVMWIIILTAASVITVWHVIGWLAATAVACGVSYAIGYRTHRPRSKGSAKLVTNAGYGKSKPDTEGVTDMDVRSAYPPELIEFGKAWRRTAPASQFPFTSILNIVTDVTAALITLGWAQIPAREAAQAAYTAVSSTEGVPVSVQSVLARALRTAGEASPKSRKVVPGESA